MSDKICLNCGKPYTVPPHHAETTRFCSRECLGESRRQPKVAKSCLICGSEFFVPSGRAEIAKYCGHKCYSISMKKNTGSITLTCKQCGNTFRTAPSNRDQKFCSRDCLHDFKRKDLTRYPGAARDKIKAMGFLKFCPQCGYDEHPEILEVHHIDRNPSNNNWSNLAIVCPNCHKAYHYSKGFKRALLTIADMITKPPLL